MRRANMNTPELTVKRAKRKLTGAILKFSVFILIAGAIGYFAVQQNAKTVYSKSDVMQRWLQADINSLKDPELESIFAGLQSKLVKIGKDVKQSDAPTGSPILKLDLVTADEFDDAHKKKSDRGAVIAGTQVNLGMGLVARASDDRYSQAANNQERPKDTRNTPAGDPHDRERFSKGLQELYSTVKVKLPDAQNADLTKYSDVLLKDYFGIYDDVKEHYPEIQVLWVYIASEETGTLAFYPAPNIELNIKLDDRLWYSTSLGKKKYDGSGERTKEQGEQVTERSDVGLTPFYGDFVSDGIMRTLWHRFEVDGPNGAKSNYVVCVDVIMRPPVAPNTQGTIRQFFPATSIPGRLGNSLVFGLVLGGLVFLLGAAFVKLGGPWSEAAARRYISGKPAPGHSSSGYVVEPMSKVYLEYSEPADYRRDYTIGSSERETKRGALGIKTPHLNVEFEQQFQEERSSRLAETRRLGVSPDEKWNIRGKELWDIYTRQQQSGTCRLCDQQIAHYGDEQRIGSVLLIHRMNHEPEVDFKRKRGAVVTDTHSIEDNVQWHALNTVETGVESGRQALEVYPKPRVPEQFAGYSFIEDILTKYRRLNEGRYVATDDLLEVSQVMLPSGIVQSVYRLSYMKRLLSDPRGVNHLKLGKDIKRFLVASTHEELNQFLAEYRAVLAGLPSSNKLLFAVFEDTPLAVLDSYKELNFSVLTLSASSEVVIVAQPESINSGYVSWREADVSYYIALFKQIDDIAAKLSLSEEQA
jgi:hypothetical protein